MTADELWGKGAAALREQLAPATWSMWFHGVRPLSYNGELLVLGVPNSLAADRIRSSYAGMLTDAIRDRTGESVRVDLLVDTDAREAQAVTLDDHQTFAFDTSEPASRPATDPLLRQKSDRHPARRRHLDLGHAQRALHLRPVRHRRLEPLRARRRALGGREPGPVLQPALHLRPGRPGQDPPPARHRAPRPHGVPQQAGALRVHRVVHERVRRRDPRQGDAGRSSGATATSTCC